MLHDVGLCVAVFDISQAGEGKVRYGDGCLWYKGMCWTSTFTLNASHLALDTSLVVFRLVVFRPFSSEVILAKVKSSDEEGIRRWYSQLLFHSPT